MSTSLLIEVCGCLAPVALGKDRALESYMMLEVVCSILRPFSIVSIRKQISIHRSSDHFSSSWRQQNRYSRGTLALK